MKFLFFAIFFTCVFAEENYNGFEYEQIDASSIIPVQDMPGFWEGRDFPKAIHQMNPRDRRIVGGEEAVPNSVPEQVALHIQFESGIGLCGGSVLSTNAVLTAAHCPIGSSMLVAIAGAHNRHIIEPSQQRRSVTLGNYRIHVHYNPVNLNNDIAILIVPSAWFHTAAIQPTRLPTAFAHELFVGDAAVVSGWGRIANSGATSSILRVAAVEVITNAQCSAIFGSSVIVGGTICVNTIFGQGPCNGDSGSILSVKRAGHVRPVQIGIVSFFASGGCVGAWPSGFTRVTSFLTWIEHNH